MKPLTLALTLVSFATLSAQDITVKTITVEPYLSHQNYEHFKRLTLKSDDPYVEYIDDFDFEWGYTYELSVEVETLAAELSDGTRFEYTLDKVISKAKVADSTEFFLFVDPLLYYYEGEESMAIKQIDDNVFDFLEGVEIEVPDELKAAFDKVRNGTSGKKGRFAFIGVNRIRLVQI